MRLVYRYSPSVNISDFRSYETSELNCLCVCFCRCVMMMSWSVWWRSLWSCRRSSGSLTWAHPGRCSPRTGSPKRPPPNWRLVTRPQRRSDGPLSSQCFVHSCYCGIPAPREPPWNIYVHKNTNKTVIKWILWCFSFLNMPQCQKYVDTWIFHSWFHSSETRMFQCGRIVLI